MRRRRKKRRNGEENSCDVDRKLITKRIIRVDLSFVIHEHETSELYRDADIGDIPTKSIL